MTTCPSGRNDWPWLMPQLQAKPVVEEEDMFLVRAMPTGRTFVVGAGGKLNLPPDALDVYLFKGLEPAFEYPDANVDAIPDCALAAHFAGAEGGGSGLTFGQTVAAGREALKLGGG